MTTQNNRLIRVEDKQSEMTKHIADITKALQINTKATVNIQRTLDELTGAKKVLLWITGLVASFGVMIATYLGIHHK